MELGFDQTKYTMALSTRFLYINSKPSLIMRLENDKDICFFIANSRMVDKFVPLMVTVEKKLDRVGPSSLVGRKVSWDKNVMTRPSFQSHSACNQRTNSKPASSSSHSTEENETSSPPADTPMMNEATEVPDIEQLVNDDTFNDFTADIPAIDKELHTAAVMGCMSYGGHYREDDFVLDDDFVDRDHIEDDNVPVSVDHNDDDDPEDNNDPPSFSHIPTQASRNINRNSSGTAEIGAETFRWMPPIVDANPSTDFVDSNSYVNDALHIQIGEVFMNKSELRTKLALITTNKNFEFVVSRSTKHRFEAVCRLKNYKWRIRATTIQKEQAEKMWQVKKFEQSHTCERTQILPDHRQASAQFIGHMVKKKFQDCSIVYHSREIISDVRDDLGVDISYNKAWRAKESALTQL